MFQFQMLPAAEYLFTAAGITGFAVYVLSYTLLTFGLIDSRSARYFMLNLTASCLVLVGLVAAFNLASALIQIFWVIVSLLGIVLRLTGPVNAEKEPRIPAPREPRI